MLLTLTGARSLAEQYSMRASQLEHAKNYIEKLAANVQGAYHSSAEFHASLYIYIDTQSMIVVCMPLC
jgi:hypothetical protein